MDFQYLTLLMLLPALLLGYQVGRASKEYPSEEEMLDRLISRRAADKVRSITTTDLETKIETASTHLAVSPRS